MATFGTQTATATKPDGRGIYMFGATPGGRIEDHVAILNYSLQTITVLVRGTDALNTPEGGFAARPIDEPSTGLGSWIALPRDQLSVTLAPRSDVIVPFLVEVPTNAQPGDHIGVITATLESSVVSKSGQKVHLLQTVGSRIFLRVSGPLHPGLTVSGLRVEDKSTLNPFGTWRAVLSYKVTNTGNVALGGRQTVDVSGLFGSKKVASKVSDIQLLLPGFSVERSVTVSGVLPELRDSAHVSIQPLIIPGTVQPASGPYTASRGFWAIPWILLAIIVVLIALIVFLWRRRRRGRANPRSKGAGNPAAPGGQKVRDDGAPPTDAPEPEADTSPAGEPVAPEPVAPEPVGIEGAHKSSGQLNPSRGAP